MNGPETLDDELHTLGSELRRVPSVAPAVMDAIRRSRDAASSPETHFEDAPAPTSRRERSSSIPRRRDRRRLLAGCTVAVVIAALVAAIGWPRGSTNVAFGQVAERMLATRTLRATVVDEREGGTLLVSGSRVRFEGLGAVCISNADSGEEVMLDTANKLAYDIPDSFQNRLPDLYGMIETMAEASTEPIADHVTLLGRRYPGHRGEVALKLPDDKTWNVVASVWSDPRTKLPVRVEIRPVGAGNEEEKLVLDAIAFDVPLDESLFDTTIPAGYAKVGVAKDDLRPVTDEEAAKLTIVPRVGVGAAKFGMTRQEIVAVLGEPEFTLHGDYLCYPSRGMQIVLTGPGRTFGMLIANPFDAASLTRNDFPGQTDAGIRIGSTMAEVIAAYGQPDPSENRGPADMIGYEKLGLGFSFLDGKVVQIFANGKR